jgi:hypothetical protein
MKARLLLIGIATVALTACGKPESAENFANAAEPANAAEATNVVGNTAEAPANGMATAASAAATPAAGAPPTKEFMVGKWGDNGDCQLAIEFKADGSMVGPSDHWELNGSELTFKDFPDKMVLTVVDANTMTSRLNGTGEPHKLNRC